jgi:hypothetical protein
MKTPVHVVRVVRFRVQKMLLCVASTSCAPVSDNREGAPVPARVDGEAPSTCTLGSADHKTPVRVVRAVGVSVKQNAVFCGPRATHRSGTAGSQKGGGSDGFPPPDLPPPIRPPDQCPARCYGPLIFHKLGRPREVLCRACSVITDIVVSQGCPKMKPPQNGGPSEPGGKESKMPSRPSVPVSEKVPIYGAVAASPFARITWDCLGVRPFQKPLIRSMRNPKMSSYEACKATTNAVSPEAAKSHNVQHASDEICRAYVIRGGDGTAFKGIFFKCENTLNPQIATWTVTTAFDPPLRGR